jgi:hypothetical protein
MCTDALDMASEPTERLSATDGRLEIRVTRGTGCGTATGTMHLTGLVADDGTAFAPADVTSESLGCYSG